MPHGDRCDVSVLINVDVPDLERAIAFYANAFGLAVGRRFGAGGVELIGWQVPLSLAVVGARAIFAGSRAPAGHHQGEFLRYGRSGLWMQRSNVGRRLVQCGAWHGEEAL